MNERRRFKMRAQTTRAKFYGYRIATIVMLIAAISVASTKAQTPDSSKTQVARAPQGFENAEFTGEVLPVLYVRDVLKSVSFYVDTLGFTCHHFFDHISGGSTFQWTYDEPPLYAEMRAGDQKFALHRTSQPDSLVVSGARIYFSVLDVHKHHDIVNQKGIKVGEMTERPWMHYYRVEDPDGHDIYIFTRPEDDGE